MRFFSVSVALIAFGAVAVAGHLVHHVYDHGLHHGHEAVSYAEVTKHEDHGHDDHEHGHHEHHMEHHHGHHEHHEHQVEHHGNNKHNDHHVHHVEHHHGHHEHHVEHHGYNGHDDHDDHHDEHHGHVKYEFKYGVKDPKTGDIKEQWEARDGDSVKGGYTLKEADGTTRLVKYTSDKKKGFEATVHKIGHAHHEQGHQEHHGHH